MLAPRDYSPIPEDWHEDSSRPFSPLVIIIAAFAWIIIGAFAGGAWWLFG